MLQIEYEVNTKDVHGHYFWRPRPDPDQPESGPDLFDRPGSGPGINLNRPNSDPNEPNFTKKQKNHFIYIWLK